MSKVIRVYFGFALQSFVIGFLSQSEVKTKTNRDALAHIFPRARRVFALSFDWLTGFFVSFVIGQLV